MKKIIIYKVLFLAFLSNVLAQNQAFNIRYEALLNGDVSVIGNQITNRKTLFSKSDTPYNTTDNNAKNNDEFAIQYINIDDKIHNFSSSSAHLALNTNERVTLKYAGLYWAATYPYAEGKNYAKNRFMATKPERENFDAVKIKFPKTTDYQTIIGKIIYDGKGKNEDAPYVAYADITSLVQKLPSWEGEYVVANIRSAVGNITNGVSAGWTIVFIYEKENAPLQKFISYDGFLPIQNKPQIAFENFKTPDNEPIRAKLVGASLGSDFISYGNRFSISSAGNQELTLQTSTRKATHFLNSSITENNDYVYSRKPNSLNTLGFDIFSQEIENQDNKYIPNGCTKLTLETSATQSSAYLFMTTLAVSATKPIPQSDNNSSFEIANETLTIIETITEEKKQPETPQTQEKSEEKNNVQVQEIKDLRTLTLPEAKSGYYVIIGAFSSKENSENFIAELKEIGVSASYFFNESRKLHYIYSTYHQNYNEAEKVREHIRTTPTDDEVYFKSLKEAWILGVNLPQNQ